MGEGRTGSLEAGGKVRERDIFSSLNIVYIKVEILQSSRLDGAS